MDLDEPPPPPLGPLLRKRALDISPPDLDELEVLSGDDQPLNRPIKQLRRSNQSPQKTHENIIPAEVALPFDAIGLLNGIAYTQLRVTANWHRFNPFESLVLLYVCERLGNGYDSMCNVLPHLRYQAFPTLQSLSLMSSSLPSLPTDPEALQIARQQLLTLPVRHAPDETGYLYKHFTSVGLEPQRTVDGVIVIVDTRGRCRVVQPLSDLLTQASDPAQEGWIIYGFLDRVCEFLEEERAMAME